MNFAAQHWAPICIKINYFWSGQFYWIQGKILWSQNRSRSLLPLLKNLFLKEILFHIKAIEGRLSKNHHLGWLLAFLVVLL